MKCEMYNKFYITCEDLTDVFYVTRGTVYSWFKTGKLKGNRIRPRSHVYFTEDQIVAFAKDYYDFEYEFEKFEVRLMIKICEIHERNIDRLAAKAYEYMHENNINTSLLDTRRIFKEVK